MDDEHEISPSTADAFRRRFQFHDGMMLSAHIEYEFLPTDIPLRVVLLLSARERSGCDQRWVRLQITCEDVSEYRLIHSRRISDIFLFEPHIGRFEEATYINLQPDDFTWAGVEDFLRSPCMVAASRCLWEIMPEPG